MLVQIFYLQIGISAGAQFDEFDTSASAAAYNRQFSFDDGEYDLCDKQVVKALIDEKVRQLLMSSSLL